jgi:hypothetical protein
MKNWKTALTGIVVRLERSFGARAALLSRNSRIVVHHPVSYMKTQGEQSIQSELLRMPAETIFLLQSAHGRS